MYSFSAAFTGASIAMTLVFGVVRLATGGLAADSLLLFGALLSALFGALTTLALILDQHALDAIRFWLAGSLSLVEPEQIPLLSGWYCPVWYWRDYSADPCCCLRQVMRQPGAWAQIPALFFFQSVQPYYC